MFDAIKRWLAPRNPARELARIGVKKRRDKIIAQAVKMRKDMGLPVPKEYRQYMEERNDNRN